MSVVSYWESYLDKAIMEVQAKQGAGDGSILVECPLNNIMHNVLCFGAGGIIESNPEFT